MKKNDRPTPNSIKKTNASAKLFPYFLLIPAVLIVIGIIFPWLKGLYQSLTNFSLLNPKKIAFVGLRNYKDLLLSGGGLHKIRVTLLYGIYSSFIEMGLGVLIAVFLNRESRGAKILKAILPMPLMIAPVIAGMMWKLMMDPSHGVLNYMFNLIGLAGSKWIFHSDTALLSLALIDAWMFTPFVVLIILAGLSAIPKDLYEASSIDGAGDFSNFFYITLPMILPYILLAGLFRVIDSFKMFDLFYVTTRGGPGEATMNLSTWAYLTGIKELRMGRGLAGLQVLWVINYVVAFICLRQIDRLREKR